MFKTNKRKESLHLILQKNLKVQYKNTLEVYMAHAWVKFVSEEN